MLRIRVPKGQPDCTNQPFDRLNIISIMDEITIDVNALFDKASFDSTSNDWIITFSDSVSILISGFWRLLSNGGSPLYGS